jgi:hypothetical protein
MLNKKNIILYYLATVITIFFSYLSINQRQSLIREISEYDNVKFDFIVSKPSKDQIEIMNSFNFIEKAVPFYSINENIRINGQLTDFRLIILENFDNTEFTSYNSKRLAYESINQSSAGNSLIDFHVFETNYIQLNERVLLNFGLDYEINTNSVYRYDNSNTLNKGTIVIKNNPEIENFLESKNYVYAGAYITSKNYNDTLNFLKDYKPLGELQQKQNIDEESYNEYLKYFLDQDHSKEIIIISQNQDNLFQSSSLNNFLILFVLLLSIVGIPSILNFKKDSQISKLNFEKGNLDSLIKQQRNYFYQIIGINVTLIIMSLLVILFYEAYLEVKIYSVLINYFGFLIISAVYAFNYTSSLVSLTFQSRKTR